MPDFTTAAVAMVGLGVGIDYALFIVTRYRENLAAGLDPERSVVRAIDTAGRAVLFAGYHRRDLGARAAAHEDVDHARCRDRHLDRRAHHHAGVGHVAAGAARVRRPQHRQVRPPAPQASRGRDQGVGLAAVEPPDPAPPVARRDPRAAVPAPAHRPVAVDAPRLRRRRQPADRRHDASGVRPRRRRLRRRGSTARCCSRPKRPTARPTSPCSTSSRPRSTTPRASPSPRRRRRTRRARSR